MTDVIASLTKSVNSIKRLPIDCSPFLTLAGEKVASVVWTADVGTITIGAGAYAPTINADGKGIVAWMMGGNAGQLYIITARITTTNVPPRIEEQSVSVLVEALPAGVSPAVVIPPEYSVFSFGAKGDGTTDDLIPINQAIASANLNPGRIKFGSSHRMTAPATTVTHQNVSFIGQDNGGSGFVFDGADGQTWFTITGSYFTAQDLYFAKKQIFSATPSGFCMKLSGSTPGQSCFGGRISRLQADRAENLLYMDQATDTVIRDCKPRSTFGQYGIYLSGTTNFGNQTYIYDLRSEGGGYPYGYPAFGAGVVIAKAWSIGEVVAQGAIRIVASVLIWQCSTAGTTAGSGVGPTTLPSTDPALARLLETPFDGTAKWKYVGRADGTAIMCDSFCGDTFMHDCVGLNAGHGLVVQDVAHPGNHPSIIWCFDMQADHTLDSGIAADSVSDFHVRGGVAGSSLRNAGVVLTNAHRWDFYGHEAFGNAKEGYFLSTGNGAICDCKAGSNSQQAANGFDGIVVNGDYVTVNDNISGEIDNGANTSKQKLGINYVAGNHYSIVGNRLLGNATGTVVHPAGIGAQVGFNVIA